jgi:hypothetical protein
MFENASLREFLTKANHFLRQSNTPEECFGQRVTLRYQQVVYLDRFRFGIRISELENGFRNSYSIFGVREADANRACVILESIFMTHRQFVSC